MERLDRTMKLPAKLALVAGGYALALLLACAVVAIRVALTSGPAGQASSGMYAFGDAMLFVAVFGVGAVVPTGAALIFLRPYRPFWTVVAAFGLAVALTGIAAAVLFGAGRNAVASPLADLAGLAILRILSAPMLALTFLLCAALAPHRPHRLAFAGAAILELLVSAFGGLVWFLPMFLQGR